MDHQARLTWLLLLSAALLSEPATGTWWNPEGSSGTGDQNSLWNKFVNWIRNKFIPKESPVSLQTSTSALPFPTNSTAGTTATELMISAAKEFPNTLATSTDNSSAPSSSPAETDPPTAPTTLTSLKEDTSSAPTVVTEENTTSDPENPTTDYEDTSGSTDSFLPSKTTTEEQRMSEILTTPQTASRDYSGTEADGLDTSAPDMDSTEPLTTPASLSNMSQDPSAPTLRLADGESRCSGRVELFYNGSWGTVCDDGWELEAAWVVCRKLGCGEALMAVSEAHFGPGSGNILLDDVECRGDEDSLWDCSHRAIAVHNCQHKEDASVICAEPVTPSVTTEPVSEESVTASVTGEPVPEDMSLRLVNGEAVCSGRLEVFHNGSWATVCDDGWDLKAATVVCRQLGCGEAVSAKIDAFFGEGTGDILLDDVTCRGDESSLEWCSHRELGMHDCYHKEDAGVICAAPLELTTAEATVPTESTEAETPATDSPAPEPDITTFPTETTMAENTVTNSPTPSVLTTTEAAAITTSHGNPDPEPTRPANPPYLPTYMRLMVLRYLTSLCGPRRPGMSSVKLQGCVRDPTCGNYYSPGTRIIQYKFRNPIYPRSCLRCQVLSCSRYSYPSQHYQGYLLRGKRSAKKGDIVIIIIKK